MNFSEDMVDQFRGMWDGYFQHSEQLGLKPDPDKFVVAFVDENFASESLGRDI